MTELRRDGRTGSRRGRCDRAPGSGRGHLGPQHPHDRRPSGVLRRRRRQERPAVCTLQGDPRPGRFHPHHQATICQAVGSPEESSCFRVWHGGMPLRRGPWAVELAPRFQKTSDRRWPGRPRRHSRGNSQPRSTLFDVRSGLTVGQQWTPDNGAPYPAQRGCTPAQGPRSPLGVAVRRHPRSYGGAGVSRSTM
jgi:hypothetical protein